MHLQVMDVDRIPYLVAAIFLTMVIGVMTGALAGNANSFFWGLLDIVFGRAGDRLDRKNRSEGDLVFRGFLFCIFLVVISFMLGQGLLYILKGSFYAEMGVVALCLTSGSVWYMILKLYFALSKTGKAEGAYYGLSRSARLDLNTLDDYGITREGIAFSATAFDKGLVAPAVWYLIGGLPVMMIYSAVSFAAWRFGKNGFGSGFGKIALALEKLMGFVPSLFSGFLLTAATSVTPTAKITKALAAWWQGKDQASYEQGGVVLSAMAWPLEVSLGGPVQSLSGDALKKAWVGPENASAQVEHVHLKRAIIMNVVAHLVFVLALLFAYIYGTRFFV